MVSYQRNPAKRVLPAEWEDVEVVERHGDDERSPKFALLPTGEEANRVFFFGTLMDDVENVSQDGDFWRGRVIDNSNPDGDVAEVYIFAGGYSPDEMEFLKTADAPCYVAVVGKPQDAFEADNGNIYVNMDIESIRTATRDERDTWLAETVTHTVKRVQNFRQNPNDETVARAREQYGDDVSKYLRGAQNALDSAVDDAEQSE